MDFIDAKPQKDRIQSYLQQISQSIDMVKKDRDYINALEKQILEDRKNNERGEQRKRRLVEHQRMQTLLDVGKIKSPELMKQEVKDFKLLHEEIYTDKLPLARCPSPSPVKETPLFQKKKSIFLTNEYVRKVLTNDFKRAIARKKSGEMKALGLELDYSDPVLKEMSASTKVDELYGLAERVILRTDEGCKDIEMALNQY